MTLVGALDSADNVWFKFLFRNLAREHRFAG